MLKTEAIKAFLTQFAPGDLASQYNHDMEVQVIVAKDQGERTEGDFKGRMWHGYTDGFQVWKPIRIPLNANTTPEYTDSDMTYDLVAHAEGIGMTGWDWKNKLSRWVAFDFDAITGHSDKHAKKLTDVELEAIRASLVSVPFVTVRRSTGGKGLHLYVFLDPMPTENHNEHAAVARAILSHMSGIAGFDFSSKVDICGGNMWIWHRKMTVENKGLEILKAATEKITVPANWRDYTKVVSGRRVKNLPKFIEDQQPVKNDIESVFEELTGQRLRVKPDCDHKRLMDWLNDNYPSAVWWDAENHMLVTHTALLKEAHTALTLKGTFETLASGNEKGYDHNCYMFPMAKGAWAIRRYTLGVAEHATWEQDGAGWTRCYFNREPDLNNACKAYEGVELKEGGYWFQTAESAQQAALLMSVNLQLPTWILGRPTTIRIHKSGKMVVEIEKETQSPPLPGWMIKGKKFERVFNMKINDVQEPEVLKLDDFVRHIISEQGENLGWVVKSDGNWHEEPFQHVREWLKGKGYKDPSVVLGGSIAQCWTVVNRPFKEEYPRDRQWNRHSPQLRYKPSVNRDALKYPTWMKILTHCGKGLDDAVKASAWCRQNGMLTGADYLKCWIASLFQEPMEPLAYLFFYGNQDCGKSIFHEAISLLVTRGVVRADSALVSQSGFNGELENAVLCVIEETDMKKSTVAYNRIKDWVTSRNLPIHAKGRQPYTTPNTTHWVQCNNSHLACPIFPGDTRITMIPVDPLNAKDLIPKKQLIPMLEAEASDFIAELLALELPVSNDRLNVPCLQTDEKLLAEYANESYLETFINERCFYAPGYYIKFSDFYEAFLETLDAQIAHQWSKKRVGMELSPKFTKGRAKSCQHWIGNISFIKIEEKDYRHKAVIKDGFLYPGPDERNDAGKKLPSSVDPSIS